MAAVAWYSVAQARIAKSMAQIAEYKARSALQEANGRRMATDATAMLDKIGRAHV